MSKKKKGKKGRKEAFDPEKDTGILRPVDMTIAAGEINDRYSDYPSRGLNPVKLASILRDADEGNVRSQMELFEEMEEKDAHLFSQMQTRKLAVTGLDWEVQPFSPDDEQDNEVRHDLTAADAKALAVTIRRDIIRPLVEYNFGADANVPFIRFNSDEEEDQKEAVDMYRTLVCDMGLKVPASHVYKRFSIPEPEEGEETLQPNMVARTHLLDGSQDDGVDPEQLKDDSEALTPEQIQLDDMTDLSNQLAARLMEQMVKPLKTLVEHFDGDLGDLQEFLKDEEKLKALYEDMESPELECFPLTVMKFTEVKSGSRKTQKP